MDNPLSNVVFMRIIIGWLMLVTIVNTYEQRAAISSYYQNQHIEDLSGDGPDELSSSLEASLHATVPIIYSSLSPFSSQEVHSLSYFSSTKSETDALIYSSLTIISSIDYSLDNSSSEIDLNGWEITQFSLPYSGPSSLLDTFIFQPSMDRPTPTPVESSTNFLQSSKLKETSWWEIVNEVPVTFHESVFVSPLPSTEDISVKSVQITSSLIESKFLSTNVQFTMVPDSTLIYPTPSYMMIISSEITESSGISSYASTEQFFSSNDYSKPELTYRRHLSISDSSLDDQSDHHSTKDSVPSSGLIQSDDADLSGFYTLTSIGSIFGIDQSSSIFTVAPRKTISDKVLSSKITDYTYSSVLYTKIIEISSEIPKEITNDITTTMEKSTISTNLVPSFSSIENYTVADMRYWLRTIIKAEPKTLPSDFLSIVKQRLEKIYSFAFSRSKERSKRSIDTTNNISIQFTRYIADWKNHQIELVYTVEYLGEPILAEEAIRVMETIDKEEFAKIIGYSVITKVEAYLQEEDISKIKPWIIYAVIGTAGAVLFFLVCIIFLYCRYCHVNVKELDIENERVKTFGEKNRQQAFEEETNRLGIISKDDKATEWERPLPALPTKSSKQRREDTGKSKLKKTSSEKILLITVETQTEGYYNPAYESDMTESSLSTVTSTRSTPDKSSKEEFILLQHPADDVLSSNNENDEANSVFHKKPITNDISESSKISVNEAKNGIDPSGLENSLPFETKSNLFNKKLGHAFSDTDAERAEAELQLSKMRQKIGDLLDDAFSFTGPKRVYSSFRNKQVLPTTSAFQRWTSLRSPNRHEFLKSETDLKSIESLPDDKPAKASHQPLFIDLPPHKQPPTKPRVVWSIYKVGDEVSALENELKQKELEETVHPEMSEKLFEHQKFPPVCITQTQPISSSCLIHPSYRPVSAPNMFQAINIPNLPYAMETKYKSQLSKSVFPVVDVHPYHPPYQTERLGDKRDEIDTATVLKFRQPAQSVIQAIRDELKKFNTSFPNDTESFA